jgi:type II secretory pathway component PulC
MIQTIGVILVAIAAIIFAYLIWKMFKTTSSQTTSSQTTTVVTAFDTAELTTDLSYVEMLSKIDIIKASPDATKACETIADILWKGAISAWKSTQVVTEVPATTTEVPATVIKTAKVATTDGTVVEVLLK